MKEVLNRLLLPALELEYQIKLDSLERYYRSEARTNREVNRILEGSRK